MHFDMHTECSLSIPLSLPFLETVTSFVRNASKSFGLMERNAMSLDLAAEELFCYFCHSIPSGQVLEIRCSNGGYYVGIDMTVPTDKINLRAMNLTTHFTHDDSDNYDELGLYLAARSVDRFYVHWEKNQHWRLYLKKEKFYPLQENFSPPATLPLTTFTVRSPDREEIKLFVCLAHHYYPVIQIPGYFSYPAKVADMVDGQNYHCLIAVGETGQLAGGIYWTGEKTVECYGPYTFDEAQKTELSRALLEGCIARIAKTQAVALINQIPNPMEFRQYMEPLGTITHWDEKGEPILQPIYFRQIHEDNGSAVWVHSALKDFVSAQYRRLTLPREIRIVQVEEGTRFHESVLSAEIDRNQRRVLLRPILPGQDIAENLRNHLMLFAKENICNVFFSMDLGRSWQMQLAPALLHQGFKPCMVLPYYGDGDVLLFQREASAR